MRWQHFLSLGIIALCGAFALVGCGSKSGGAGDGTTVAVTATEFKFDPANITVAAGKPVTISLINKGTVIHDWTVQGMSSPVKVQADPGKTANLTFTASTAGTFKIICDQPAHAESGMVGQLTVQ